MVLILWRNLLIYEWALSKKLSFCTVSILCEVNFCCNYETNFRKLHLQMISISTNKMPGAKPKPSDCALTIYLAVDEWRYTEVAHGKLSVLTNGISMMHSWHVDSLGTPVRIESFLKMVQISAFPWRTYIATDMKIHWATVYRTGVWKIVTMDTQVSYVPVSFNCFCLFCFLHFITLGIFSQFFTSLGNPSFPLNNGLLAPTFSCSPAITQHCVFLIENDQTGTHLSCLSISNVCQTFLYFADCVRKCYLFNAVHTQTQMKKISEKPKHHWATGGSRELMPLN